MNTHRQLGINSSNGAKSIEKLSSGLRINRAGDDAAGLAISEKMRAQVRGLNQASRNAQDGISLIQTAEGALNESHEILQRMRELTIQAANDTMQPEDRTSVKTELDQLSGEIDRIATTTQFNGKVLLTGNLGVKAAGTGAAEAGLTAAGVTIDVSGVSSGAQLDITTTATTITVANAAAGVTQTITVADATAVAGGTTLNFDKIGLKLTTSVATDFTDAAITAKDIDTTGTQSTFQIGANQNQKLDISIGDMQSANLGVDTASLVVSDYTTSQATLGKLDSAITQVSTQRSNLGAYQNRLEHTIKNLDTSSENLQASESRIRDVDMAKEMMNFTKNNILQQAAQAMLAQANQQPQGVLQLLR